jgi:general secretion pathway protein D
MSHSGSGVRRIGLVRSLVIAISIGVLGGCQATRGPTRTEAKLPDALAAQMPSTDLSKKIPKDKLNTAARQLAAEGLKALDAKQYVKASEFFNLAVKTDITNPYLHFLNGVAYQLRGMTGESALFPLAEQGYQMAVQFDNSNWLARYYSGLLAMHQRDFARAQKRFAEAALYAPNQPDLLYDLAVVSYYNRDPKTAAAALEGLRQLGSHHQDDPQLLRASAIVSAALNQPVEANGFLQRLRAVVRSQDDLTDAEGRVNAWLDAHKQRSASLTKTAGAVPQMPGQQMPGQGQPMPGQQQMPGAYPPSMSAPGMPGMPGSPQMPGTNYPGMPGAMPGVTMPGMPGASPYPYFQGPGRSDFVEKQMVAVDVVILSTEEDNTDSMGVNLLDGLRLQFGNTSTITPGLSWGTSKTTDNINPSNNSSTEVLTKLITIPAVNYSLNIANAAAVRNEVLARPTLVALGNQTSTFFAGVDIIGAAVSAGQGSSVQIQKEVGVKLSVTPEFLPDNLVKLNVVAERNFLAIPSTSVKFDFRLDTAKTMVNANVVMRFGETLILSGLSERDKSSDRNGVPLIQDIPIAQYFFSHNVTRDYYRSVLILLTPRRTQYTNRPEAPATADPQLNAAPEDTAVAEFEEKYRNWYKSGPTSAQVMQQLEGNSLYREFRTGDLGPSWRGSTSHQDRLSSALRYLFY